MNAHDVSKEADYLLAVKGNQGNLEKAFDHHFSLDKLNQWEGDRYMTRETGHGRTESRMYVVSDIFDEFVNFSFDWPGLKTLGIALREHWHRENKLHWKLDVAMREDDCRIRRDDGAEVFAGLKRKQKKAALSTRYLSEALAGQGLS